VGSPPSGADPAVPARTLPAPVVLAAGPAVPAESNPVRVRIPVIDVDSSLTRLDLDDAGALAPPADPDRAGWFGGGPVPGAVGPAVITGHVDSQRGPAVFFRLEELAVGDTVQVDRDDGGTVEFRVTRVATYPKDRFATAEVYGPAAGPELRLITCGGDFDRGRRSYRDNVVVYARQV
jgi:sortase (surface protein transpeptidase)